jgi:hypothetical protein
MDADRNGLAINLLFETLSKTLCVRSADFARGDPFGHARSRPWLRQMIDRVWDRRHFGKMQQSGDESIERAVYAESAPNMVFTTTDAGTERTTTVGLFFGEFTIGEEYIGHKPSQLFLMMQFMDCDRGRNIPVAPRPGMCNGMTCLICKNDQARALVVLENFDGVRVMHNCVFQNCKRLL